MEEEKSDQWVSFKCDSTQSDKTIYDIAYAIDGKELTDVDVLLIGKTGNGKSATGNSIIGRDVFEAAASMTSVTKTISCDYTKFNGRTIKVVDCPGVGDTDMSTEEGEIMVRDCIQMAIEANPRGYHAILIVIGFGIRFGKEEKDTIIYLKRTFGHDFIKKHGILILTRGDNFENVREKKHSFKEWCDDQKGAFKELLEECEKRVILFDNVTENKYKRNLQISSLLIMIDNLCSRGYRYTDKQFTEAKVRQENIMLEAKLPMVSESSLMETSLILTKMVNLKRETNLDTRLNGLVSLKVKCNALSENLKKEDKKTNVFSDLIAHVEELIQTIKEEIYLCEELKKDRMDNEKQILLIKKKFETEYNQQIRAIQSQVDLERAEKETKLRILKKEFDEKEEAYKQELAKKERGIQLQAALLEKKSSECQELSVSLKKMLSEKKAMQQPLAEKSKKNEWCSSQ